MEQPASFMKGFSKEHSPEERKNLAREVHGMRAKIGDKKRERQEKKRELLEVKDRLGKLSQEIEGFDSLTAKIKDYFHYRRLSVELKEVKQTHADLSEKSKGSGSLDLPEQYRNIEKILDEFYKKQTEKWKQAPYTKEELEQHFSEEHLSSLSLDDYILLLRRFPNEMVTHVTRQGVRDHMKLTGHRAGFGKHFNGFKNITEGDHRLHNQMTLLLAQEGKEEAVNNFIGTQTFDSPEEALRRVDSMLDPMTQINDGSYTDFTAIHMASEEVADAYYGAETGNEIFFVFPSAMIASQYHFKGQLIKADGAYHNNKWIWANEEKGIGIDSGIVFIPGSAEVDKETGSRYKLDKDLRPVDNEEYINVMIGMLTDSEKLQVLGDVEEALGTARVDVKKILREDPITAEEKELKKHFGKLWDALAQGTDIKDVRLLNALFDYQSLSQLRVAAGNENKVMQKSAVRGILENSGVLFVETEHKISAEEYWENYFAQHPDKRPPRIVYYAEQDPTQALIRWKERNQLYKRSNADDMGFTEHRIDLEKDADIGTVLQTSTQLASRFRSIAKEAINNYFEHHLKPEVA